MKYIKHALLMLALIPALVFGQSVQAPNGYIFVQGKLYKISDGSGPYVYRGSGSPALSGGGGGTTAAITMSTATTTQFVALSGTTLTYVSSLSIVAGGTTNVTLVHGTGSNCATDQTALTGAYPLTAQTGFALSGLPAIVVPAGKALCVTSSAAVQVSGHATYAQY